MKNTPFFMIMAAAVSAFASCDGGETPDNNNGDNGDNGNPNKGVMVESVTLHDEGSTFKTTFEYDDAGRVKKITEVDKGNLKSQSELTYGNDRIVVTRTSENDEQDITYTYTLNSDGYAVSMSSTRSSSVRYEYDKEGYLIKEAWSFPETSDEIYTYTWADGCLKSQKTSWSSSDFTYGSEKNDKANLDIPAIYIFDSMMALMGYQGKGNSYLVESVTTKSDDVKEDGTETYRYEKDADGRISKIYVTHSNSGKEVLRFTVAYLK